MLLSLKCLSHDILSSFWTQKLADNESLINNNSNNNTDNRNNMNVVNVDLEEEEENAADRSGSGEVDPYSTGVILRELMNLYK